MSPGPAMTEARFGGPTPAQDRSLLKALWVALAVGLGLAAWGAYLTAFHVELRLFGEEARGQVVALERGSSSHGSSRGAWFPVVEFETPEGRLVTFRHRTGRSPAAYAAGDRVPVVYLPDGPDNALIAECFLNWLLPLLLIVVGPGLGVLSLRGIRGARRRLRAR